MKVLLTGGTGFVGRHMLARLGSDGHEVRVLARHVKPTTEATRPSGNVRVECLDGDVISGAGLDRAAEGCEAVIHLVGIIVEIGGQTFEKVHHVGTRNVVGAAKKAGVKRFVQMSALGARADGVSGYQTSKWHAEESVRQSGIAHTILRPSLIFGPSDGFVTQMVEVMKAAPLVRPIVGHGRYRFRPIYIDNVVDCFAQSLTSAKALNRTIDLGGPDELTLEQIMDEIAQCIGVRKMKVHVPFWIMQMNARALGTIMSRPPVTIDQLRMLAEGSTCDIGQMRETFELKPVGFREGLEKYLCKHDVSVL